jgi:hypothetical protein
MIFLAVTLLHVFLCPLLLRQLATRGRKDMFFFNIFVKCQKNLCALKHPALNSSVFVCV